MELPNIKELEKLLKMCRKQGVFDLTIGTMSFKLGDLPKEYTEEETETPAGASEEEIIYWSTHNPMAAREANQ